MNPEPSPDPTVTPSSAEPDWAGWLARVAASPDPVPLVRADQVARWRAGEPRPVDDYLAALPGLPDDDARALIMTEAGLRRERGESPAIAEYQKQYPHLAGDLSAQFKLLPYLVSSQTVSHSPLGCPTLTLPGGGPAAGRSGYPAIPGYEILGELGRGGMGVVYKAHDRNLNRVVALKMVLHGGTAGSNSLVRFLAEAEALAALHHPHVVQVYDRGQHLGLPFFTMEHCPGGSLGTKVKDNPLPAREAARVVEKLARGVAAAHAAGILHRDLKPENVLFAADETPKLTDFGLAKRFDDSGDPGPGLTQSGAHMGTPSYMAPEQAKGESKRTGPATDVYGLGAVLYRLVTGRPPFLGANTVETMRQVVEDEPVSPTTLTPGLPRDLTTICLKCLAKDPARRYPRAADLADDLRRYLDGRTIEARPVGAVERAAKWVGRNRTFTTLAAALAAVLIAGIVVSLWQAARANREKGAALRALEARDQAIQREKEIVADFLQFLEEQEPDYREVQKTVWVADPAAEAKVKTPPKAVGAESKAMPSLPAPPPGMVARTVTVVEPYWKRSQVENFLVAYPKYDSPENRLYLRSRVAARAVPDARRPEAGTQPAIALNPNMFGD